MAATSTLLSNNRVSSRPDNLAVPAGKTLRQPTREDWETLRPRLVQRYQSGQATARFLAQELREQGHNFTIKMLRDRLRSWHVEPKYRRPQIVRTPGAGRPSVRPTCETFNAQQRRLLNEINRCFDLSWRHRKAQKSFDLGIDLGGMINDFSNIAVVAVNAGRPKAWNALHHLVSQIESMDLSKIDSFNTAQTPYYSVLRPNGDTSLVRTNTMQAQFILLAVLTQKLDAAHPHVKFSKELLGGALSGEVCAAVMEMDESMGFANVDSPGSRSLDTARARARLASILLRYQEHKIIDEALGAYESDDGGTGLPDHVRSRIFFVLGSSMYQRGKLEHAERLIRRATQLTCGEKLGRIFEIYWLHLACKLRTTQPFDNVLDAELVAYNIDCVCREVKACPALHAGVRELVALKSAIWECVDADIL